MITLDQVLMLEQKVESAVVKIQQLQAENDALRKQCAELTNALSSKSEQLTSFETNQNKIESGILNALDRLNQIENSVLKVTGQDAAQNQVVQTTVTIQNNQPVAQTNQSFQTMETIQSSQIEENLTSEEVIQKENIFEQEVIEETPEDSSTLVENSFVNDNFSAFNSQNVENSNFSSENNFEPQTDTFNEEYNYSEEDSEDSNNLGFDIF
jgi:hypothetical protein